MKRTSLYSLIILCISLLSFLTHTEGFLAGTLVKTKTGYTAIETILPGDYVVCFDDQRRLVERPVIFIAKKQIDRYISLMVNNEVICADCDQKLLSVVNDDWIAVQKLREHDLLMAAETNYALTSIEMKNECIDVYSLSVAEYHNFFVSKADLLAHNLFPVILLGLSCAFGGGFEFAGMSLGLAGLGTYLGYQWHKKDKGYHSDIVISAAMDDGLHLKDSEQNNGAQAPGMPTANDGYFPPKKWDGKKVKNPRGTGYGWPDRDGNIWVPSGPNGHGGPHWDVQIPRGKTYRNILPGGRER